MRIQDAILLVRAVCNRRHLAISTEESYTHWLRRYGLFLKQRRLKANSPEPKMEAFLTYLAGLGVSASTQNQAFNALLFFYRDALKQELGPVNSLRARRPITLRDCPSPEEVQRLLSTVTECHGYPTRLIGRISSARRLCVLAPELLEVHRAACHPRLLRREGNEVTVDRRSEPRLEGRVRRLGHFVVERVDQSRVAAAV